MRCFHCANLPEENAVAELPPEEALHGVRVLRLRPGDAVMLMDGRGGRAEAEVTAAEKVGRGERLAVRVLRRERWAPPPCRLHLLVAPPRAKLFGQLLKDATELGVGRITPVLCEFSVARPDPDAVVHAQADLLAASKQSGNPFLPELRPPQPFAAALAGCGPHGVFGDPAPDAAPFRFPAPAPAEFAVWIGPEGGFSSRERDALLAHGMTPLRLGNWILRVETAVTAILGHLLGTAPHELASRQHPR